MINCQCSSKNSSLFKVFRHEKLKMSFENKGLSQREKPFVYYPLLNHTLSKRRGGGFRD